MRIFTGKNGAVDKTGRLGKIFNIFCPTRYFRPHIDAGSILQTFSHSRRYRHQLGSSDPGT